MSAERLAVVVATRNRTAMLVRALQSLRHLDAMLSEVFVVDDGSTPPVEPLVRGALAADDFLGRRLMFVRHEASRGLSASRNVAIRRASTPWLLNLDDDAVLVSGAGVRSALDVVARDARVGAVAFAQADAAGAPLPAGAQPAAVDHPARVASFTGFGFLLRVAAARALGGFRETLPINGEEREFCLRLLDAGFEVVYLPEARIAHLTSSEGRDARRYLHQTVRHGVLDALYNLPLPLAAGLAVSRLMAYHRMRRGWGIDDPGGFADLLGGLMHAIPGVLRERKAVRWSTVRRWRALNRAAPAYEPP